MPCSTAATGGSSPVGRAGQIQPEPQSTAEVSSRTGPRGDDRPALDRSVKRRRVTHFAPGVTHVRSGRCVRRLGELPRPQPLGQWRQQGPAPSQHDQETQTRLAASSHTVFGGTNNSGAVSASNLASGAVRSADSSTTGKVVGMAIESVVPYRLTRVPARDNPRSCRTGWLPSIPMGRPRACDEERVATAIRLPASLHQRLRETAAERDVSANLLATTAISNYLEHLPPLEDALPRSRREASGD